MLLNRQRVIRYVAFAIKKRPIFTFTKGTTVMAFTAGARNVQKKPPRRVANVTPTGQSGTCEAGVTREIIAVLRKAVLV